MRKLFFVMSLLVVASMALAACGTPAPVTTAPPVVPVVTEAPVVVPTEEPAMGPTSPYVGSGMLDGNGIPGDFFADAHIRRAFS